MSPDLVQTKQHLSDADKKTVLFLVSHGRKSKRRVPSFLQHIIFYNECSFSLQAAMSKRNCRSQGFRCPGTVYKSPQSSPMLMNWCHISKTEAIEPYIIHNGTVGADKKKNMLRNYRFPKLASYPSGIIFLKDEASAYYATMVRKYLDQKLSNRRTGRVLQFRGQHGLLT